MRAVAVTLVLLYHTGFPGFAGGFIGVDVFFVISGFLITGLIVREIQTTSRFSLLNFYARRARRLLPATAIVLVAVGVVTIAALPETLWATTAGDITASGLYFVNWRFAHLAVDYLASDSAASPVQHFWSLAVEEQFYLVWPVLVLGLLWLSKRSGWSLRRTLLTGISLIAIPSLLWSIHLSATLPGPAFFVSTTRAWELSIGAALALSMSHMRRLPPLVAQLLGWFGIAAILAAGLWFDQNMQFPGYAALLPTAGTAALIASGTPTSGAILPRLLSLRSLQPVGTLSYSIYLWHWPALVAAGWIWAGPDGILPVTTAILVVLVSMIPASLSYRLIEAPVHHHAGLARRPRRSLAVGLACTAIGITAGLALSLNVPRSNVLVASPPNDTADAAAETAVEASSSLPEEATAGAVVPSDDSVSSAITEPMGAEILWTDPTEDHGPLITDTVSFMTPSPVAALEDVAALNGERCIESPPTDLIPCTYGSASAETVVAVVGDSKMHQWLPAIEKLAAQRNWRIETYLANGCALVRVPVGISGGVNKDCAEYNEERYSVLLADEQIDYIITSQRATSAYYPDDPPELRVQAMVDDLRKTWLEFEDHGINVIVILDNPAPPFTVPDCVAAHSDELSMCVFSRDEGFTASAAPTQLQALDGLDQVDFVDLSDWICPTDVCPPVIGNVLVYRQGSHLTVTYVDSLLPKLDEGLEAAMDNED